MSNGTGCFSPCSSRVAAMRQGPGVKNEPRQSPPRALLPCSRGALEKGSQQLPSAISFATGKLSFLWSHRMAAVPKSTCNSAGLEQSKSITRDENISKGRAHRGIPKICELWHVSLQLTALLSPPRCVCSPPLTVVQIGCCLRALVAKSMGIKRWVKETSLLLPGSPLQG